MASDIPQHAVRDGDYRVIYVVGNRALYKMFPDAGQIMVMLPVEATEQGHMVGYAGLSTFAEPIGVRLLIPTKGAPFGKGGVWDSGGGVWALHPVPEMIQGWDFTHIVVNPTDTNHWVILGSDPSGTVGTVGSSGTNPSTGGTVVDRTTGASPLWETKDGGTTWTQIVLPSPDLFSVESSSRLIADNTFLAFSQGGVLAVFTPYVGIGSLGVNPGLAFWAGVTPSMSLRFADVDNLGTWGDTTNVHALGLAGASGTEFLIAANFGSRSNAQRFELAVVAGPGAAPSYITDTDTIRYSEVAVSPSGAYIAGSLDDHMYAASNYHNAPEMVADLGTVNSLAYTIDGIFVGVDDSGNSGIYHAFAPNGPYTNVVPGRVYRVVRAVGRTMRTVVARSFYNEFIQADEQSAFEVFENGVWGEVPGPADPDATNIYLSTAGLACIESTL
jgi:hypothetical protein